MSLSTSASHSPPDPSSRAASPPPLPPSLPPSLTHIFGARPGQHAQLLLLHVPRVQILKFHFAGTPASEYQDLRTRLVNYTGVGDSGLRGHAPQVLLGPNLGEGGREGGRQNQHGARESL
jgi:hypothetical protein